MRGVLVPDGMRTVELRMSARVSNHTTAVPLRLRGLLIGGFPVLTHVLVLKAPTCLMQTGKVPLKRQTKKFNMN